MAAFCKLIRSASNRAPRALKFIDTPVPPGESLADSTRFPVAMRIIAAKRDCNACSTALNALEVNVGSIAEIDDIQRFQTETLLGANPFSSTIDETIHRYLSFFHKLSLQ